MQRMSTEQHISIAVASSLERFLPDIREKLMTSLVAATSMTIGTTLATALHKPNQQQHAATAIAPHSAPVTRQPTPAFVSSSIPSPGPHRTPQRPKGGGGGGRSGGGTPYARHPVSEPGPSKVTQPARLQRSKRERIEFAEFKLRQAQALEEDDVMHVAGMRRPKSSYARYDRDTPVSARYRTPQSRIHGVPRRVEGGVVPRYSRKEGDCKVSTLTKPKSAITGNADYRRSSDKSRRQSPY